MTRNKIHLKFQDFAQTHRLSKHLNATDSASPTFKAHVLKDPLNVRKLSQKTTNYPKLITTTIVITSNFSWNDNIHQLLHVSRPRRIIKRTKKVSLALARRTRPTQMQGKMSLDDRCIIRSLFSASVSLYSAPETQFAGSPFSPLCEPII